MFLQQASYTPSFGGLGFGLKDISAYFGFIRTDPEMSSFEVPRKYDEYLNNREEALKQQILDHNADDLRSLLFVWQGLRRVGQPQS